MFRNRMNIEGETIVKDIIVEEVGSVDNFRLCVYF